MHSVHVLLAGLPPSEELIVTDRCGVHRVSTLRRTHAPKHARTRKTRRTGSSGPPLPSPKAVPIPPSVCAVPVGRAVSGSERLGLCALQLRRSPWAENAGQSRLCWARIICWPSFWSTAMVCTEGPVGRTKSQGEMRDEGRLPEVQTRGGGDGISGVRTRG